MRVLGRGEWAEVRWDKGTGMRGSSHQHQSHIVTIKDACCHAPCGSRYVCRSSKSRYAYTPDWNFRILIYNRMGCLCSNLTLLNMHSMGGCNIPFHDLVDRPLPLTDSKFRSLTSCHCPGGCRTSSLWPSARNGVCAFEMPVRWRRCLRTWCLQGGCLLSRC